ncbi:glycosyltransferase family 9 protein [Thiotrichales bacterium 19S9-12]|nr:glycosyltransferase family 9 protein [Thiotrichales bacterium 19S9-11]MCF6811454.1 glycosyltransferase family 9 protein [Thiotrichales bacterium 19S9-12]
MFPIDLDHKKLLIVRADNIGDLVCTTPLIEGIKKAFPTVTIDVMLNTYNQETLLGNPHIRSVVSYEKAKHRKHSIIKTYFNKYLFFRKLKKENYDYALLAGSGFREKEFKYLLVAGIKKIIGYYENNEQKQKLRYPVKQLDSLGRVHEVELVYNLGKTAFNLNKPGQMHLYPNQELVSQIRNQHKLSLDDKPIGIHLSSRKPQNRWPIASYITLVEKIKLKTNRPILVFWAPGSEHSAGHPGDDEKAAQLFEHFKSDKSIRLYPVITTELSELIAGVSLCDSFICCDGGTMHVAAALVDYMVAIFGSTNKKQWGPWGVKHQLLQKDTGQASDIAVNEVVDAFFSLEDQIKQSLQNNEVNAL